MRYIAVFNNQTIALKEIPDLPYMEFRQINLELMQHHLSRHCVNYFAFETEGHYRLFCCIADDYTHLIYLSSCIVSKNESLPAMSAENLNFEKFEREIHENYGIRFTDHPWLKPVRYPHNRADHSQQISNYPFFSSGSIEMHEVGVGPIHAGIIEPGHFRFICNGEKIMHLEIQLGYQHRGIENLMIEKKNLLQRTTLAENIAGDTVNGHSVAFINLWESLCDYQPGNELHFARTLSLEIERIAIHTGDLSALCTDVAYQLGNSVYGRLRTPVINFFQEWCGNRLAKSLNRAGKTNFPFTLQLAERLTEVLDKYEPDFNEMSDKLFSLPSALSRFERTGEVKANDIVAIGAVGMAARMSGLSRDIRTSHPHDLYTISGHQPVIKHHGDVYSRAQIRRDEIRQSIGYIRKWLGNIPEFPVYKTYDLRPAANSFAIALVEGWRGEICHCAITDNQGELAQYKIKDPSFHNWLALALAVRNHEISDFPLCNKSFNLSYCGHDL